MRKPRLRLVAPATVNRTVTLRRPKNGEVRTREHLTEDEVEKLIEAAKHNRHGHRDALMVLLTYRHGLRAAEVVDLRCAEVELKSEDQTFDKPLWVGDEVTNDPRYFNANLVKNPFTRW